MKLVDTSVAIDHLRGVPAAVSLLTREIEEGRALVASEVVRFELLAGVRPAEQTGLEEFFEALTWVTVGEQIARTAADLARRYRRSHSGIDDGDYMIAATALALEVDLLTTNVRHFPMLDGLETAY